MSEASQSQSALTPEVKAVIGATAEKIEASFPWGIEREGLRIFTQAIMDPDPRYWDDEFAKTTKFGGIITPPTGSETEHSEYVTLGASGNSMPAVGSSIALTFEIWYDLPSQRKEAVVQVVYSFEDADGTQFTKQVSVTVAP